MSGTSSERRVKEGLWSQAVDDGNYSDARQFTGSIPVAKEDAASQEADPMAYLSKRLGSVPDITSSLESPKDKAKRIKQYTLKTMEAMLEGVTQQAEAARCLADLKAAETSFNENMASDATGLMARLDNELVTPEGAAMMAGLFIGAMTNIDTTMAVIRELEQCDILAENEIREKLRDLERISLYPLDDEFRQLVIESLNGLGDQLLGGDDASRKLGAAYIGIAAGVAIGSRDRAVVTGQREGTMGRLLQL